MTKETLDFANKEADYVLSVVVDNELEALKEHRDEIQDLLLKNGEFFSYEVTNVLSHKLFELGATGRTLEERTIFWVSVAMTTTGVRNRKIVRETLKRFLSSVETLGEEGVNLPTSYKIDILWGHWPNFLLHVDYVLDSNSRFFSK